MTRQPIFQNKVELDLMVNELEISPLLITGGSPTIEDFQALRSQGCQVVIDLALIDSPDHLADEANLVTRLGMEYIHIPVIWARPTRENLLDFFTACEGCRDRKVFIHCVKNMRVSAFLYLYRVLRLGVPKEDAFYDMASIWEPDGVWADFIQEALASQE